MQKQSSYERHSILKFMDKTVPAGILGQHQESIEEYATELSGYVPVDVAIYG